MGHKIASIWHEIILDLERNGLYMKKVTKKRIIIYSAIIVVIVAGVLINNTIQNNKETMAQFEVTPSTSAATVEDIGIYIPASGAITSGSTVSVLASTQGTVLETFYKTGDFVNAGDVIAVVEQETLEDEIDASQASIDAQRSSIDKYDNDTEDYTIKAPVTGRVKEINVTYVTSSTSESNRERAEDIEDEYGYLVAIAVGNSMYITVEENTDQFEAGMEVDALIHEDDGDIRIYSGAYVEKILGDTVYIHISSNTYDDNVAATVYTSDGATQLAEGTTEYKDMAYVVGAKGYIESTSTYMNQYVNEGDILYYSYSNISQTLVEMYAELESLEEELADLQEQYENLQITAPVSGFIQNLSIAEGDAIGAEMSVCTIADTSIWTAEVDVDELDVNSVEIGMPAAVTIDAIADEEFIGSVSRISSVGTNSSGVTTYTVEIELPADERFKLSMNASSEIQVQKVEDAVSVPIQAVRYSGEQAYVLVYVDRSEEEIDEIIEQILDAQDAAEEMASMSEEEMMAQMEEMRESMGENTERGQGQGQLDPSSMSDEDIEEMQGMMGSRTSAASATSLSVADQMYGEIVYVEVGIQDETNIEIISGLEAGTIVLLPTTDSDDSTSSTTTESSFAMPGTGMGGGMGGR